MKLKWAILALCAAGALMAQRIPVTARGTVHRADSGTTATLPAARLLESGQYIEVMCASASNCTVASAGGLIDGGASFTVASGITVRFVSDGAGWFTAGGTPKANSDGTISAVGANAGGSVSSVAMTVPSWLTVTGSPITSSGTLAVTATTGQAANRFVATPNGSTGAVSLRTIVGADLPLIDLASGTAGGVTGNLPVSRLNSGSNASGATYWRGDGTWETPAGAGDVVGPSSAVNTSLAAFNGTTGKLLYDTNVAIANVVTAPPFTTFTSGTLLSGGGTHLATTASLAGDVTTATSGATTVTTTVAKVNGVTYSASPSTNTVPVVTASNTATYKALPTGGTNGCAGSADKVLWNSATQSFSCGTDLNTGSGTVTSVGLSLPAILSVSGSPVTTSGTISATLATQSANLVFAGPASGASATPTFRSLTADDLPPVSTENPYEPNLSGWTSSGTETVTEATHGRGGYAWGACYADNTTLMEAVACKVEHSKTTGDLSFTYTTKPFRVRIYRGDKAQGPAGATGATGATGAAGALNLVGIDGTSQTTRARINLKTGSDMTITAADNAGTNSVDVTIGATATGIKNCNDASGSGTTYTCPSAGASSLTDLVVMFKPQTTSSGAATVNVSSLGAKSILRQSGNSVISGELRAGERYLLKYNGTAFVMDGEYLENTDGALEIGRGTHPRTINVTAGVFAGITSANDLTGANSFSQRLRLIPMAYASLPTCVSGIRGAIAAITDSNTVTWGATAAGGGSDYAQVNCNGTNWTVTGK